MIHSHWIKLFPYLDTHLFFVTFGQRTSLHLCSHSKVKAREKESERERHSKREWVSFMQTVIGHSFYAQFTVDCVQTLEGYISKHSKYQIRLMVRFFGMKFLLQILWIEFHSSKTLCCKQIQPYIEVFHPST